MNLIKEEKSNVEPANKEELTLASKIMVCIVMAVVVILGAFALSYGFALISQGAGEEVHTDNVHLEIGKEYTISVESPLIIKTDRVSHYTRMKWNFEEEKETVKKTLETRIALGSIGGVMSIDEGKPVRSVAFVSPSAESMTLKEGSLFLQPDEQSNRSFGTGMAFRVATVSEDSITLRYLGYGKLMTLAKKHRFEDIDLP